MLVLFRFLVILHDFLTAIYNYMIVNSLCKNSLIHDLFTIFVSIRIRPFSLSSSQIPSVSPLNSL